MAEGLDRQIPAAQIARIAAALGQITLFAGIPAAKPPAGCQFLGSGSNGAKIRFSHGGGGNWVARHGRELPVRIGRLHGGSGHSHQTSAPAKPFDRESRERGAKILNFRTTG
jgi:hypothetical protein